MPVPSLCQGRIVWVDAPDARGNVKRRPVIIITSDDDIDGAEELVGVVCSHTSVHVVPRPGDYIEVPHDPAGVCRSKLRKPTVAICQWTVSLTKSALAALGNEDYGGIVPATALEQIVDSAVKYLDE
ncbi:MAG TPA: type II toxin-antitoxin system PemK/MazF family toxin [Pirellulales bacterium]|nr:type II toxin-antitoxin system PemK/MazF family toxin [Pirellulales bacterium]